MKRYASAMQPSAGHADHASDQPPGAALAPATISTTTGCFEAAVDTEPSSKSTARRRTWISTARSPAAPSPPGRPSRSTAIATAPSCSPGRCSSASVTARRGWVEPRHVLNTRPLGEVRALIESQARVAGDRGGPRLASAIAAALAVALGSFALYRATLLPGVDFGDTGSIQTMVGSALVTPRDGYPLLFRDRRSRSCGSPATDPALAHEPDVAPSKARSRAGCSSSSPSKLPASLTAGRRRRAFSSPCRTRSGASAVIARGMRAAHAAGAGDHPLAPPLGADQPTTARLAAVFACLCARALVITCR